AALIPSQPLPAMQRTDVWRLESAALEHNAETLIGELERMLAVSRAQARRIVNDELGEPIVVAAKAWACRPRYCSAYCCSGVLGSGSRSIAFVNLPISTTRSARMRRGG